jgi:hypothetical protein
MENLAVRSHETLSAREAVLDEERKKNFEKCKNIHTSITMTPGVFSSTIYLRENSS